MAARSFLSAYVLVGVLNVVSELLGNVDGILLTKPLLMPLLVGWLIATAGRSGSRPMLFLGVGLVFAWAGDLLLLGEGDALFALGLGAFLVMQVLYIAAFVSVKGPSFVRAWPVVLVPYVAAWAALLALTWSGAGALLVPVVVYGTVLVAMGVLSLDVVLRLKRPASWRIAAGGALFIVSDGLIALTAFGPLEASDPLSALVMATYIAAQGLIVVGLTRGVLANSAESTPRGDKQPGL